MSGNVANAGQATVYSDVANTGQATVYSDVANAGCGKCRTGYSLQ